MISSIQASTAAGATGVAAYQKDSDGDNEARETVMDRDNAVTASSAQDRVSISGGARPAANAPANVSTGTGNTSGVYLSQRGRNIDILA